MSSHGPVRCLACPARFERATYALEALKMWLNNTKNNGIKVLAFGVASNLHGYMLLADHHELRFIYFEF